MLELQKRLNEAREQINLIPGEKLIKFCYEIILNGFQISGIDQSKPHQIEQLENLNKQLVLKQELINKYKQCNF